MRTFNFSPRSQYLGMLFDFSIPGECRISMPKLIDDVLKELDLRGASKYPHDAGLYMVDEGSSALDAKRAKVFYSTHWLCSASGSSMLTMLCMLICAEVNLMVRLYIRAYFDDEGGV